MSQNLKVCDVDPAVKEKVEKFRLRKEKTVAAIVLKIVPDKLLVVIDEEHEDISIEDLREELPAHQPRYVVLSYVHKHDDGRVSFPFCFIFISPQGCKPELHMMYSGTKTSLTTDLNATKVFELRSVEELTEEWLKEKIKFFR
ncbi:glia maturation factor beta-like [Stylophora pistillata]|uniref:glia maturation factor beta-like n=1 Tax=Stylophora pistillata TaxID=50429 RepID=UPI000C056924|nr:glia maturation factor beta-like [Stylophora pistillata]